MTYKVVLRQLLNFLKFLYNLVFITSGHHKKITVETHFYGIHSISSNMKTTR